MRALCVSLTVVDVEISFIVSMPSTQAIDDEHALLKLSEKDSQDFDKDVKTKTKGT